MLPTITYPAELPVSGQREEIARAIRDHQVVIVAGATGSGKTTQLPKICLELGRESIAPHKVGDYANLVEEPADASTFFDAGTWDRLCAVKSSVDPDDVVVGTHHVPARARA